MAADDKMQMGKRGQKIDERENVDVKMGMIKCGWKNMNDNLQMI